MSDDNLQNELLSSGGLPGIPDWAFNCYKAHCHRGQTITSLANKQGVAWITMRRNVDKIHALVQAVENSDLIPACDKYIAGLRETLSCLWRDYQGATHDSARVGCLKLISQVLEQIAAAEGVVTQRKAAEVSGPAGGPLHVVTTQELLANDAAVAAALDLEEALAGQDTTPGGQQPLGDGADTQ